MTSKLTVKVGADVESLKHELRKASGELNSFQSQMKKVSTAIAATFTVDLLIDFGKEIINTTAKFQKFEAVLTNTLGSNSEAKQALQEITDFAAKTPFQVDELTESFVKLVNQGFKPTKDQMTALGDLAASQGKSFDQLTEAIIDAQTGEFERLKEFGIRASKEGDRVTFTFKGVEKQVNFTSESIRQYILSLGGAQGVSGSMAAISETLGGKISNLQDSLDQLKLALGQTAENGKALSASIDLITASVQSITNIVKSESFADFLSSGVKMTFGPMSLLFALLSDTKDAIESLAKSGGAQSTWEEIKKGTDEAADALKKYNNELAILQSSLKWQNASKKLAEEVKPLDTFDPDFDSTKDFSFGNPSNVFDPVAGITAEIAANQQLTTSLYDVAIARQRQLEEELRAQEVMRQSIATAVNLGEAIGASVGEAIANQQSAAEALKAITSAVVDEFYKQAVAAVVANSAQLGPFGVGLAIAGLAVIKSIFSSLGSSMSASAGGSHTSYHPSEYRPVSGERSNRNRIEVDGKISGYSLDIVSKKEEYRRGRVG